MWSRSTGCLSVSRRAKCSGFSGPNGSGKTTALRSILGISEPDAGTVTWNGRSDRRRHPPPLRLPARGTRPVSRHEIGEQLAYFATSVRRRSRQGRRAAGGTWLERLGLGERVDDKVDELSLGNQQRVQLAAALIHEPELLVLDEPFSGLDPISIENVGAILREQADGRRRRRVLQPPARPRRGLLPARHDRGQGPRSSPRATSTTLRRGGEPRPGGRGRGRQDRRVGQHDSAG